MPCRRCVRLACLLALALACGAAAGCQERRGNRRVVRITGSDTMVNLLQAWAEQYKAVRPDVIVQVAGGGSGVGIAGLLDGTLDVAAASREMRSPEREGIRARLGGAPEEITVARDALAVFVHRSNPLQRISIDELAEIYGEHGTLTRWPELGIAHPGCASGSIIRIGRQNNSGTFAYFRDVVLGRAREYKMGSIDQSGSKDVVALVSRTPCAIGYSGVAYASPGVKALMVSATRGGAAVPPAEATVLAGSYPLARPLYLYTGPRASEPVQDFLAWVVSAHGQQIVSELGFVPLLRGAAETTGH